VYKCKYFKLHELLPKQIYENLRDRGKIANGWFLFDDRLLMTLDDMREEYGRIYVNTWYWGGYLQYCGFRPGTCLIGAAFSQHKFGRAADPKFLDKPTAEVREEILASPDMFPFITCVEIGVPHLHFDVRNYSKSGAGILTVSP